MEIQRDRECRATDKLSFCFAFDSLIFDRTPMSTGSKCRLRIYKISEEIKDLVAKSRL